MAIVTRLGKGSKLTIEEMDNNLLSLETDISGNVSSITSKLDKGSYTGSAKDLENAIIAAVTGASGISIVPTSPAPSGTEISSFTATQAGTYTNYGGVVVAANSFAIISRSAAGVFSISQTALDLTTYAKISTTDSISDKQKMISGGNIFSFDGYVQGTTGIFIPQTGSNNVCTPFIELVPTDTFSCTNLQSVGTTVRQVSFYSSNVEASFISSYTTDDSTTINLTSANIPTGTQYIRFNRNKTKDESVIIKNGIKSNKNLGDLETAKQIDINNTFALETGVNLFTITGFYVNKTTGALDTNAGFKCTDYLKVNSSNTIVATGLSTAGAFRQVSFFSAKTSSSLISSYTTNDLSELTLDYNNIPYNTAYVRFNTTLASVPTLSIKKYNYSSVAPLKVLSCAWDSISVSSGYSAFYGKYWNGSAFVNNNDFCQLVYAVTVGSTINVKGNCDTGNNPIIVFFNSSNINVGDFVANSTIPVINGVKFYDAKAVVPTGATHAIVQQRRLLKLEQPFAELVKVADTIEVKKKVVLIGDSFSQMAGYAGEELMSLIKPLYPEYDIFNYGIGGEKTNEILSRVGAFQMYLTPDVAFTLVDSDTGSRYFTLPSTTATVEIGANSISNSWNTDKLNLLAQTTPTKDCEPKTVIIDGVECLLTKVSSSYFLNRTVAGASTRKIFVGAEMIVYNIPKLNENDIAIVNTHQNGGWTDTVDLVAQVQRLVDSLGTKKYIVLSSHYAQTATPANLDSVTNRILQEDALRKAFGAKYVNMRAFFTTRAVIDALATTWWNMNSYPTDTVGETHPNATDISYMSTGRFAPMFWCNPNNGADIIHLSRRSYLIYYKYIFNKMIVLKYFK
jgi:hypothetical protein